MGFCPIFFDAIQYEECKDHKSEKKGVTRGKRERGSERTFLRRHALHDGHFDEQSVEPAPSTSVAVAVSNLQIDNVKISHFAALPEAHTEKSENVDPKLAVANMDRVAILGANSLIGQHLYGALLSCGVPSINVWELNDAFSYRIKDGDNLESRATTTYTGLKSLRSAIEGRDIVFNLHELQDFTIKPDVTKLKEHNVEFVKLLLDHCKECHVNKLIHLSSVFLQASAKWPNVLCREETDYEKFRKEVPFSTYCESKHLAEQLIEKASPKICSVSARVGSVYGEGDLRSVICDKILLSNLMPSLPQIGDENGVFQLTYAGNVAYALIKCAEKLHYDADVAYEMVLINDNTPVKHVNIIARQMLGKNELKLLPSPQFLYMTIHHWTFYSDYKLRLFFNYTPHFLYETSLFRSAQYYRQLDPSNITRFSWMPNIA